MSATWLFSSEESMPAMASDLFSFSADGRRPRHWPDRRECRRWRPAPARPPRQRIRMDGDEEGRMIVAGDAHPLASGTNTSEERVMITR